MGEFEDLQAADARWELIGGLLDQSALTYDRFLKIVDVEDSVFALMRSQVSSEEWQIGFSLRHSEDEGDYQAIQDGKASVRLLLDFFGRAFVDRFDLRMGLVPCEACGHAFDGEHKTCPQCSSQRPE